MHNRSGGEVFAVTRNGKDLGMLVQPPHVLAPVLVALEATGDYGTVVASAVGAAQPLLVITHPRSATLPRDTGELANTDRFRAAVAHLIPIWSGARKGLLRSQYRKQRGYFSGLIVQIHDYHLKTLIFNH